MAETLHLPPDARRVIVDHCAAAAPAEGCGLVAVSEGAVRAVYPTGNDAAGLDAFVVPPAEHFSALRSAEGQGWALGGSFHSHPGGDAVPSPRDVAAALDPEWVYLIVGGAGEVRAWRIIAGTATEIGLTD